MVRSDDLCDDWYELNAHTYVLRFSLVRVYKILPGKKKQGGGAVTHPASSRQVRRGFEPWREVAAGETTSSLVDESAAKSLSSQKSRRT